MTAFQRAADWWDRCGQSFGEWTCEGRANGFRRVLFVGRRNLVAADGDRTRYQRGAYGCM